MQKSRKGSMQLSIEVIIILIFAIVLLGLGLAFIKGSLTKVQEPLQAQIDSLKSCNANSENPILPTSFNVDNEKLGFDICVYNNGELDLKNAKVRILSCMDDTGSPTSEHTYFYPDTNPTPLVGNSTNTVYPALRILNLGFSLEKRKSGLIPITITTFNSLNNNVAIPAGTYICNVVVQNPVTTIVSGVSTASYTSVVGPIQVKFLVS